MKNGVSCGNPRVDNRLIFIIFLIISIVCVALEGVEIIKNPVTPSNKNPGTILKLREVLCINDESDKFFFRSPGNIKIASDGSIFVIDTDQLLKFSSAGKFIANFFKRGQGPEEVVSISDYLLHGNTIIFHDSAQNKVLFVNHETGELIKEFKITSLGYNRLLSFYDDILYFWKIETKETGGKMEIFDADVCFFSAESNGSHIKKITSFPVKYLTIRAGDRFFTSSRAKFLSCPAGDGYLYISHTPEYEIKLYNFKTNTIVKQFTRKYERVKVTGETRKYAPGGNLGKVSIDDKTFVEIPVADYHLDIQKLLLFKDKLWVVTSTVVNGKRVLVDVFDKEGVYIDNFYLDCPSYIEPYQVKNWIQVVDGDFIYFAEQDEDGNNVLKKYKIGGE